MAIDREDYAALEEAILKKKLARVTLPCRISELENQLKAAKEELAMLPTELAELEKLYESAEALRAWLGRTEWLQNAGGR